MACAKVTIIVEWENAKLSELDRAEMMLGSIFKQTSEYSRKFDEPVDLIILYDSSEISADLPNGVFERVAGGQWPGSALVTPAPGSTYYEQKNLGAAMATSEYVLFIDSDVIPDPGWFENLMSAVAGGSEISVISGETYCSLQGAYERLCAGFWNFGAKPAPSGVRAVNNFYANNVLFRRDLFMAFQFPVSETFRGQCTLLARTLRHQGHSLHRHSGATVSHPPPNGIRHFVSRALCQGHDAVFLARTKRYPVLRASPLGSLFRLTRSLFRAPRIVADRYAPLSLKPLEGASAVIIAWLYSLVSFIGELFAYFAPRTFRRVFRV